MKTYLAVLQSWYHTEDGLDVWTSTTTVRGRSKSSIRKKFDEHAGPYNGSEILKFLRLNRRRKTKMPRKVYDLPF